MKKTIVLIALAVVCAVQAGVIAYLLFSPGLRYRRTQTELSLNQAIYKQVHAGDTLEQVTKLLGPGVPAGKRDYIERALHYSKFPEFYPDGIQETDTLLLYPNTAWTGLWLQFRNGKLINHIPAGYKRDAGMLAR